MARKSIFEILEEKYDFNKEFQKIRYLFGRNIIHKDGYGYSIISAVNGVFHDWKGRGSCLSCADMHKELGLDELEKKKNLSVDEIIFCLEYMVNILFVFIEKSIPSYEFTEDEIAPTFDILKDNINLLLEHLNYTKQVNNEQEQVLLIPKAPAAIAVAETAPKDIAFAILKYNHSSLKGQLEEKRRLLQSIANEYEELFKKPIEGFSDYFKTARGLLNNLNIRHNNMGKDLIKNISNQDLERCYDELYQLMLFCILIRDNKQRLIEAKALLGKA